MSDLHQLRMLSPDADTELTLKFYGNATDDDKWYETFVVVDEAHPETTIGNMVMAAMAANAGSYIDSDDVTVDAVQATFERLLRYFLRHHGMFAREGELQAFAHVYTLLHFLRNNCVPQIKEMLQAVKYAVDKPLWYALLEIKLPHALTPFELLNDFWKRHERTVQIKLPADNFAVRLVHFALINEAYGAVGALLGEMFMLDALPLSLGHQLVAHLTTRVDFTLAFQEKEPRGISVFVSNEAADALKKQLANFSVETLWPSLSFLSQWTDEGKKTKKYATLRRNIDTIEAPDEQALAAAAIVDSDAERALAHLRLLTSQMHKDLSAAVEFRERCRGNLFTAKQRLEEFCERVALANRRAPNAKIAQMLVEASHHIDALQECLDVDEQWVAREYSLPPPMLPNDEAGREGILVAGDANAVSALHAYITTQRSRLAYYTRELESAMRKKETLERIDQDKKLEMLRDELASESGAAYFGDE